MARERRSFLSDFSWSEAFFGLGGLLILLIALLLTLGIATIYSVRSSYAQKQAMWACVGLIPFFLIVLFDYKWILKQSYLIYIVAIVLLLITAKFGIMRGGSRRWLKIGPLLLQTSEIMKLALIVVLARVLSRRKINSLGDLCIPYFLTGIPWVLIALQPDLGTSLVLIPILLVMVFSSGVPIKKLVISLLVVLNLAVPLALFGLKDYQINRIKMFVFQGNMSQEERRSEGYHLVQSKIAHGNGGLFGQGHKGGSQNQGGFLPERHTDFIFAVVGESWGFAGTTLVLVLYLALYFTMLLIAYTTPDSSMQLMVIGVMTLLLTQTVVNTCMTVGMAPITGLPLPFLSYGGSSLMFNLSAIALIVSVAGRRGMVK